MTLVPPFDSSYPDHIYNALAELGLQLDADPLVYGPKRLNEKTALARKLLTDCERMFLEVSQRYATYKRLSRAATLTLDMSVKGLLANDPETRAGRAVAEREAIAYGKLKVEVQAVADTQRAIEELEDVLKVIKAKRSDLRDIQGRLRDQVRLCQEEIGLGGRWGSKNPRGIELQPGQGFATGEDATAINDLMGAVLTVADAERHLTAEVDTTDPTTEQEVVLLQAADSDPIIPGENLVAKFGFVPHCAECGDVQFHCPGGMSCPNGHGGADSVPPGDVMGKLGEAPEAAAILPSVSSQDDVAAFLQASDTGTVKSRRQIEEEDAMDLDSILMNFGG